MSGIKFTEILAEEDIEEANTVGSGNVVGYTGPIGIPTIKTNKRLAKAFWGKDAEKKNKTASPKLHKEDFGAMQDTDTPTKQLHMVQGLWDEDEIESDVKTDSPLVEHYQGVSFVTEAILEPKRKEPKDISQLGIVSNGGVNNIIAVYNEATPEEKEYWGKWYHYAKSDVEDIAIRFKLPFPVVAAITAVLSPGSMWKVNLMAVERLLENALLLPTDTPKKIPGYPRQVARAKDILNTGNVGLVTGPKVTVFFQSLLSPASIEKELVLDGHAINIWRGEKGSLKNIVMPNKTERARMVEDYHIAADKLGISVQSLQAVTWYIWKYTNAAPKVTPKVFDVSIFNDTKPANDNSELLEQLFLESSGFENLVNDLNSMRSLEELTNYVTNRFKEIGHGGYRTVFEIDDKAVLKIMRWEVHQHFPEHKNTENKMEVEARSCLSDDYFPKLYAYDSENYRWLISERVRGGVYEDPIFLSEIYNAIVKKVDIAAAGIEVVKYKKTQVQIEAFFDRFIQVITDDRDGLTPRERKITKELKKENPWLQGLVKSIKQCGISPNDLHAANWGIRANGDPVILDYGFDESEELNLEEDFKLKMIEESAVDKSPQFFIDKFSKVKMSYQALYDILRKEYKYLGSGVSRVVFALTDDLVIKINKPNALQQNANEIDAVSCLTDKYAPKIYGWSEDFMWLISERVKNNENAIMLYFRDMIATVSTDEQKEELIRSSHIDLNDPNDAMDFFMDMFYRNRPEAEYFDRSSFNKIGREIFLSLRKNYSWFKKFTERLFSCKIDPNDLHPGNWGIRRGQNFPVLLDAGFEVD